MSNPENTAASEECPPTAAAPVEGDVWRCCKSKPPKGAEMKTHHESGRLPNADPCRRQALSVFCSETDAIHQVKLFQRWRRKFVAKATLDGSHGRSMLTKGQQPTHTSWWPAESLDPAARAALFTVVSQVKP